MPKVLPEDLALTAHPELSVVVCTRNRLSRLKCCVEALLSVRTAHNFELIVVDNGSTDGTSQYLAAVDEQRINPSRIRVALEPRRGLAAARNSGWRVANAEVIAFTDDDCYVAEDYVDSVLLAFDAHPGKVGFVGGRILLFDPSDFRITIQEAESSCRFMPRTFVPAGAVQGANMAFRRAMLDQIGGFDERLGAGTSFPSEDIDAAAAVLWAGVPGAYDPRPVVYHHHGRKTEAEANALMRGYDAGRGAYFMKYILRKDSRTAFLRAWAGSIKGDFLGSFRKARLPQKTIRELSSGLRFALQCAASRRDR